MINFKLMDGHQTFGGGGGEGDPRAPPLPQYETLDMTTQEIGRSHPRSYNIPHYLYFNTHISDFHLLPLIVSRSLRLLTKIYISYYIDTEKYHKSFTVY